MNYNKYKVKYHWYKEGYETDDEMEVKASSAEEAMAKVEKNCFLNYKSCKILSVETFIDEQNLSDIVNDFQDDTPQLKLKDLLKLLDNNNEEIILNGSIFKTRTDEITDEQKEQYVSDIDIDNWYNLISVKTIK